MNWQEREAGRAIEAAIREQHHTDTQEAHRRQAEEELDEAPTW